MYQIIRYLRLQFTRVLYKKPALLYLLALAFLLQSCFSSYSRYARKNLKRVVRTEQVFDAIIVPGIPFNGDSLGHLMRTRIIWSWILYKNGITRNVIFSGGAVHTPYQEARVMGLYAQQLGIPPEHIFYDTCALHSTENVYYSHLLAQRQGFEKIALASDIYQSYFLKIFIRKHYRNIIYELPVVRDSLKYYSKIRFDVDERPALIANAENFIPLGKKENYWQRMRGTLGWNISRKRNEFEEGPTTVILTAEKSTPSFP